VACEHLAQLDLGVAQQGGRRPFVANVYADLIRRKGTEHEASFLEALQEAGRVVTQIGVGTPRDFEAGARATIEAMRAGAEYVYQAVFLQDGWRGVADFLERVERPSAFGSWSYEVLDTKLARHPRPEHALQLCFYTHALGEIQELAPELAHVVLGTRERVPIRLANVAAYYRRLRHRFGAAMAGRVATTPYPCEHCAVCDFRPQCEAWWEQEDHLVRVAGIRRDQVGRLVTHGVPTLTTLAEARADTRIPKMLPGTFEGLRDQASLQLERQRSGRVRWQALPIESGRGFSALPQRSPGDVILDLEGHPFFEPARGLAFLFGVLIRDGAVLRYTPFWAQDREGERRALEAVIDLVHARLRVWPDLHVYHFGVYEPSGIKRLVGEHATGESEVDDLLRRKVFVDLHTVLRQALRAGVPSYSLKDVEALFGFIRTAAVGSGMDAIVSFERWLETKDDSFLAGIAAYNEEDCRATSALLDWLHEVRPAQLSWPTAPDLRVVSEETAVGTRCSPATARGVTPGRRARDIAVARGGTA
jgi:uncharacterized protein